MTDERSDVEFERARWFADFNTTGSERARDALVESYLPLADFFARRYADRTVELDDLQQVARMALVKALDRFDPSFNSSFSTFAGRTIDGELKRHFRDKSWAVRVPRSIQEKSIFVGRVQSELEQANTRAPTPAELAKATGLEIDEVIEALDARANYRAARIDKPTGTDDGQTIADTLTSTTSGHEESEMRMLIRSLLDTLSERDQEIVRLRFFDDLSQQEIAEQIGVSQMQVSRILRRSLASLQQTARDQT